MVGWSNVILDPTLALIRAQLGFRIQVRAECANVIMDSLDMDVMNVMILSIITREDETYMFAKES